MKKHLLVFTNIALAGVLTACAPQPPKCSDEGTTKLLLQLLVERLAEVTHADKATIERKLSIMLPIAVSMDEKVHRLNCEATVKVEGGFETSVTYTSMLDDKNRHMVILDAIPGEKAVPLLVAVEKALTPPPPQSDNKFSGIEAPKDSSTPDEAPVPSPQGAAPSPRAFKNLSDLDNAPFLDAVESPLLAGKLKTLLKDDFPLFLKLTGTYSSFVRNGDFFVGTGCMPHSCGFDEGAVSVDANTGVVVAAIYTKGQLKVYGARELPESLRPWHTEHVQQ